MHLDKTWRTRSILVAVGGIVAAIMFLASRVVVQAELPAEIPKADQAAIGLLDRVGILEAKLKATNEKVAKIEEYQRGGLRVVATGYIDGAKGNASRMSGHPFKPTRNQEGVYSVTFVPPLASDPIVVATSEGGWKGSDVRIRKVTKDQFIVEGRNYHDHGLADTDFWFIVVESENHKQRPGQ